MTSRRWTLAATVLGSCMAFIDGSVVNIAIPVLQKSFGATVSDTQWIVDAYAIVLASLMLAGGAIGDHVGRRRVFGAGVALFAAASAWCGAAATPHQLIAARTVQGLGAAMLVPGSLAIISAVFPPEERGRAIGTWSALTSLAVVAGPLLGGWLVQTISWRAVFYINVPIAAATLLIVWRAMPPDAAESPAHDAPLSQPPTPNPQPLSIDWLGTLLVTFALAAIAFSFIEAPARTLRDPLVTVAGIGGVAALIAFVILERRIANPIMPLSLFRSRAFTAANALTFLLYGAMGAVTFLLPFDLIQVQGYSPARAGAAFLPFVLTMSILSRWTGALADRIGPRIPLTVGPLVAAAGIAMLSVPYVVAGVFTMGLGMAITVAPLTTTVMTSVDDERHTGAASGINNTVARAAGLLAIALFGAMSVSIFTRALDARIADPHVRATMHAQRLRLAAAAPPSTMPVAERRAIEAAVRDSFAHAFRIAMLSAAALAALSALGGVTLPRRE
jgi:EmrB/QacA subfamily drug resistance transporter